jgi:hypothetical protein
VGAGGWPTFAGFAKVGGEGADTTLIPCPTVLDCAHARPSHSLLEAIKKRVAVLHRIPPLQKTQRWATRRLIDEGVTVDPKRESYDFGRFGWFTDPEGNRVELWQPSQRVDAELAQMSPEVGLWEETRFRFPRSPFLHNSRVADNPGVITCGPKE